MAHDHRTDQRCPARAGKKPLVLGTAPGRKMLFLGVTVPLLEALLHKTGLARHPAVRFGHPRTRQVPQIRCEGAGETQAGATP